MGRRGSSLEDLVGTLSPAGVEAFEKEVDFFRRIRNSRSVSEAIGAEDSPLAWIRPLGLVDLADSLLLSKLEEAELNLGTTSCDCKTEIPETSDRMKVRLQDQLLFEVRSVIDRLYSFVSLQLDANRKAVVAEIKVAGEGNLSCLPAVVEWLEKYCRKEFNTNLAFLQLAGSHESLNDLEVLGFVQIDASSIFAQKSSTCSLHPLAYAAKSKEMYVSESKILTAGPSIGFKERSYTADAVSNGWNDRHSDYLALLSREFADFVGSKYALPTSSCTGALHLAMASLGLSPGDEVIVPAVTWVATASAVAYTGATPIFADIEPTSWTIDVAKIEALITSKTKAVVAVHLYGYSSDVVSLREITDRHGIFLIEDAAPAIGATFQGRLAGTVGNVGCFSFQGAKLLVSGEGGMLVTDSKDIFEAANKLQEHGRRPGTFWIDEIGYKYKMSNLTASLALGQLQRIGPQIEKKRRINAWYKSMLAGTPNVSLQENLSESEGISWMTSILLSGGLRGKRELLATHLADREIDTRPVFPNLSQFSFWNTPPHSLPVSDDVSGNALNLPSGVSLNRRDIARVANAIREFCNEHN